MDSELVNRIFSFRISSTSSKKFDLKYYPDAIPVTMLTETDWNISNGKKPQWVGFSYEGRPFKLEEIPESEYSEFKYCKAEKVINPYLERAFDLKTTQHSKRTTEVYHGTIARKVDSILKNNFNWRLAGSSRGVKHGKGVSFSQYETFATRFCRGIDQRIIRTRICYRGFCTGYQGDVLPRLEDCDTTKSPNGNVYVKFEDSEFLPIAIYYLK